MPDTCAADFAHLAGWQTDASYQGAAQENACSITLPCLSYLEVFACGLVVHDVRRPTGVPNVGDLLTGRALVDANLHEGHGTSPAGHIYRVG